MTESSDSSEMIRRLGGLGNGFCFGWPPRPGVNLKFRPGTLREIVPTGVSRASPLIWSNHAKTSSASNGGGFPLSRNSSSFCIIILGKIENDKNSSYLELHDFVDAFRVSRFNTGEGKLTEVTQHLLYPAYFDRSFIGTSVHCMPDWKDLRVVDVTGIFPRSHYIPFSTYGEIYIRNTTYNNT